MTQMGYLAIRETLCNQLGDFHSRRESVPRVLAGDLASLAEDGG